MLHNTVDLNLFYILKTVYDEGSITRAAEKLHLSQPAVSHALARIRKQLDDPLFERQGKKMLPTRLTISIMPRVEEALGSFNSILAPQQEFDIGEQRRTLTICCRDMCESLYFSPLIAKVNAQAPKLQLESQPVPSRRPLRSLAQHEADLVIDALIPADDSVLNMPMFKEPLALVHRQGHSIEQALTLDNYLNYQHVFVTVRDSEINMVGSALAQHKKRRQWALKCEHYLSAVQVVASSDHLLTMPQTYARQLAHLLPVTVSRLPFNLPPVGVHAYWHRSQDNDPVLHWLLQCFAEITRQVIPENQWMLPTEP